MVTSSTAALAAVAQTKSPATVSRKREYSQNWPETFGSSVAETAERESGDYPRVRKSPLLPGFSAIPSDPLLNGIEPPNGGIKNRLAALI
jgi:hypothetical protein